METPSTLTTVIAGSCAGASETLVTYPFEFIKTRRQLPAYSKQATACIIRDVYTSSGLKGFYTGCGTLAASNALKASVRFMSFAYAQVQFDRPLEQLGVGSVGVNIAAGLAAGVAESVAVVAPGECIKTRLVQSIGSSTTPSSLEKLRPTQVLRHMVLNEGPFALWKGLGPVLLKQGTNSAIRFATFGSLKAEVASRWPERSNSLPITFALGGISGVVTVYASMPFDNIKTRLQSAKHGYRGILDCGSNMLRHEGVRSFWIGSAPRLARLILSSAITFAVYDQIVSTLRRASAGTLPMDSKRFVLGGR